MTTLLCLWLASIRPMWSQRSESSKQALHTRVQGISKHLHLCCVSWWSWPTIFKVHFFLLSRSMFFGNPHQMSLWFKVKRESSHTDTCHCKHICFLFFIIMVSQKSICFLKCFLVLLKGFKMQTAACLSLTQVINRAGRVSLQQHKCYMNFFT